VVFGTKALTENMQLNISRNFGETEQYLLCNLLYTGSFAHCANWLAKLTLDTTQQDSSTKQHRCQYLLTMMIFLALQSLVTVGEFQPKSINVGIPASSRH